MLNDRGTIMDMTGGTTAGDRGADAARPGTAVMLRLLISLMGDEVGAYKEVGGPPDGFRSTVREATTPALRSMLLQIAAEMDKRRGEEDTK